ncbi:MAG: hypothetical protein ACE14V_00485 [bacterium]
MQCQNHNDREAIAMCISCRNFFCAECRTVVDGKNYCIPCSEKVASTSGAQPVVSNIQANDSSSSPLPALSVPPPPIQPAAPVTGTQPPPVVKKKSGCLKWAIIIIILFVVITAVLAAALYVGWRHFAPKLQPPAPEQQYTESTTEEQEGIESGEQSAPVAEDTTIETQPSAETEPAPAENAESEPETETDTNTGSEAVTPPSPAENKPNAPPPGMMNPRLAVPPIDPVKLLSLLPKAPFAWQSGVTKSGTFQKNNITYTSAQREYYFAPQSCKIILTIYDYGRNPQMYKKFIRPAVFNNTNEYQKLVDIKGHRGIEKMNTKTRTGELSIEVVKRYVVEIQGENIPNSSSLEVFAQDINLSQLAQLQ